MLTDLEEVDIFIALHTKSTLSKIYVDSLGHYNKIEISERYKTNNETLNSFEHVIYSNK
ncbi:hypothetical protein [Paenibacillus selenitireducens]|uniref:hypothetical protein n=1 Tax=Paenibacillus selenitireducens TaxID=1324314 RepID=UPI0013019D01|nr:hypothetical protein [Paenibacillus selenitireducens]